MAFEGEKIQEREEEAILRNLTARLNLCVVLPLLIATVWRSTAAAVGLQGGIPSLHAFGTGGVARVISSASRLNESCCSQYKSKSASFLHLSRGPGQRPVRRGGLARGASSSSTSSSDKSRVPQPDYPGSGVQTVAPLKRQQMPPPRRPPQQDETSARMHVSPLHPSKRISRSLPPPQRAAREGWQPPPVAARHQTPQVRLPIQQRQQEQQQQQPQQQQWGATAKPSNREESLSLVEWLRDSQLPLEGWVLSKGEEALVAQLLLPAAAQHLLPARVRIPRQFFLQEPSSPRATHTASASSLLREREDLWRRVQPGDSVTVRVLGAQQQQQEQQQQPQQQQQQQQQPRGAIRSAGSGALPPSPRSLLELIVQPILEKADTPVTTPAKVSAAEEAAAQAAAQNPRASEQELEERLSSQRVSRWLRFLSPPTATWMVPAPVRENQEPPLIPRRQGPLSPRGSPPGAPPSTRPLRCKVVGLSRARAAAVVEVLQADDEWHPAVSSISQLKEQNPTQVAPAAAAGAADKQANEGGKEASSSGDGERSQELSGNAGEATAKELPPRNCNFAQSLPHVYQQAERELRLEQQTQKDALLQEELLAQQEVLLHKMLPHEKSMQLKALQRLCQQHPQLHAYHNHLNSYLDSPQEDARGALALLPLQELGAFMRFRKDWRFDKPLRLYFSSVEVRETPGKRPSQRTGSSGVSLREFSEGEASAASDKSGILWFSIYPAVPLEIAHLLLHDMPVPHLAPHFRLFEQRQMAQQHEEHQQLVKQIQHYHEALARERVLRKQQQRLQEEKDEPQASAHTAKTRAAGRPRKQTGKADRVLLGKNEGQTAKVKPGAPSLQRLPVRPPWWASGDWMQREVRLSMILGPFFYRQLLRMRAEEEGKESQTQLQDNLLDPRGERFEDITRWLSNPQLRLHLTPSFVRRYLNALRTALKLAKHRDYPFVFQRFLDAEDLPEKEESSRMRDADLTAELQTLLTDFLPLRNLIRKELAKHANTDDGESRDEVSGSCLKGVEARNSAPVVSSASSPLMQLIRLHSRLRWKLRPQQRAPSLEQWTRMQQQRRVHRKVQPSSHASTADEVMEVPQDASRMQQLEEEDEFGRADKLVDEVERQLIDCSQAAPDTGALSRMHLPYTSAYPSLAIRKPRGFYNYMGEDVMPVVDTEKDEALLRLAGGPGTPKIHELFLPLPLEQQQAAASTPPTLDPPLV
ncbi:hypothetical protein Emag_003507 [Eimeria magna]